MWIEILTKRDSKQIEAVTPFAGVWIEIPFKALSLFFLDRHSLRGSVDWNTIGSKEIHNRSSHSLRGSVDWNNSTRMLLAEFVLSLPSRECGLKFLPPDNNKPYTRSLPSRECGLKYSVIIVVYSKSGNHSLRGSVDWNRDSVWQPRLHDNHSLRGSVDWNRYPIFT